MKCLTCGSYTTNPKYCSRSCSATASNLKSPRNLKSKHCKSTDCSTLILASHTYCEKHWRVNDRTQTIGSIRAKAKKQVDAYARSLAREWARKNLDITRCAYCGYGKHTDTCHITPLSSFKDDTPVVATYQDNIVILCKNHHWEFDHGLLDYDQASGKFTERG